MRIYKATNEDTLSSISKKFGILEEDIARINGIRDGKIAEGEELLILVPTRVHTAKHGDSLERICLRYKVRKNDVLKSLLSDRFGMAVSLNGAKEEAALGVALFSALATKKITYVNGFSEHISYKR